MDKQRSEEAEEQKRGEADKQSYKNIKGGKNRKTRSKEAEKQRNRETEIQKKCPKRKRNSSPKEITLLMLYVAC